MRRLRKPLVILSALPCAALVAAWVRSHWRVDGLYRYSGRSGWNEHTLELERGRFVYVRRLRARDTEPDTVFRTRAVDPDGKCLMAAIESTRNHPQPPGSASVRWMGFRYGRGADGVTFDSPIRWVVVPLWAPVALTAAPPLLGLRAARRRRR